MKIFEQPNMTVIPFCVKDVLTASIADAEDSNAWREEDVQGKPLDEMIDWSDR